MLDDLPLVLVVLGLIAYAVLAGADFGAGIWILASPGEERGRPIREHARHAMGPVWEANHVWLIFVIVVSWTAYPEALASVTSTLAIPFGLAAIGIIMRGTAYALRAAADGSGAEARFDRMLGVSSILTPFALGAAIASIAARRVPVGNAAGDLASSWLNATSLLVGALAVVFSGYLAAVYLSADAQRRGEPELVRVFRTRALVAGCVAGALAIAALPVVHADARSLWDGLSSGWGLVAIIASIVAGIAALALVWRERYEPARVAAAAAVAAVVAGWALANGSELLPGLTIDQAAAGHSSLVALLIGVAVGAVVLAPSLALLFGLVLAGHFDRPAQAAPPAGEPQALPVLRRGGLVSFVLGAGLLLALDSDWSLIIGLILMLGGALAAFPALAEDPESS